MKRVFLFIAIASLCLVAACDVVENTDADLSEAITYIKANGNENATKGSVDGFAAFTWNTGDQIAVWTTGGYKISSGLASTYDAQSTATFSFSGSNAFDESERELFAFFPASLVSGQTSCSATTLTLTLPASYTLAEVEDEVSPTPMIADNVANGTLAFKALCPLLRITVNNIPKQTKRIEFDFNGKKVQGTFTLSSVVAGTTAIETSDTEGTDDIITVTMADNTTWHDNLVVNLPVPTGTYDKITITAYDAVSGGHSVLKLTKPIKSSGSWEPTRKTSSKMTATLPVFSVGNGKYVTFAPGNLQYQASTNKWRFAENQWDIIGDNAGNTTAEGSRATQSDWIDLFGWGTSGWNNSGSGYGAYYHPYDSAWGEGSAETAALYGPTGTLDLTETFARGDWGVKNAIGDYPAGTWRTPTGKSGNGDLYYLLFERDDSANPQKSAYAIVNGNKGVILLPDVFIDPQTNAHGTYGPKFIPKYNSLRNSYSGDGWKAMEEAGAVFFPMAGHRSGTTISSVGSYGYYWTATAGVKKAATAEKPEVPAESNASRIIIRSDKYIFSSTQLRSSGLSVRLVRDLN